MANRKKTATAILGVTFMLSITAFANDCGTKWITVGQDPTIEIDGLAWLGENHGKFYRLPIREKENITSGAWDAGECTSGGRVRFKTDSTQLKLSINHGYATEDNALLSMWHMPSTGKSGIELYLGSPDHMAFWLVTTPKKTSEPYIHTYFTDEPKQLREFTLYLPNYANLAELKIGVDPNAVIEKPTEYKTKKPIVYYGTSITQGGCASRSSHSFPAIISRRLNADFVNLGFSGAGRSEPIMAKLMAEIDASVYVVDPVANMTPELMKERYEKFITILRQAKPNTPIILMTRLKCSYDINPNSSDDYKKLHEPLYATYEKFKEQGDKNIYVFDTGALIEPGGDHPTVDGLHLTDRGFYMVADKLSPLIEKILDKIARK